MFFQLSYRILPCQRLRLFLSAFACKLVQKHISLSFDFYWAWNAFNFVIEHLFFLTLNCCITSVTALLVLENSIMRISSLQCIRWISCCCRLTLLCWHFWEMNCRLFIFSFALKSFVAEERWLKQFFHIKRTHTQFAKIKDSDSAADYLILALNFLLQLALLLKILLPSSLGSKSLRQLWLIHFLIRLWFYNRLLRLWCGRQFGFFCLISFTDFLREDFDNSSCGWHVFQFKMEKCTDI